MIKTREGEHFQKIAEYYELVAEKLETNEVFESSEIHDWKMFYAKFPK